MRTKGVFLLGLIVCWIAVCNGDYGSKYDRRIKDKLAKELAEEDLFMSRMLQNGKINGDERDSNMGGEGEGGPDGGKGDDSETEPKMTSEQTTTTEASSEATPTISKPTDAPKGKSCKNDEDCGEKYICEKNKCECAPGLSGNECEKEYWCEGEEQFKNCRSSGGTCEYKKEIRTVVCECPPGKEVHLGEKGCKGTCAKTDDCKNGGTCTESFCSCPSGLIGDNCEKVFDCTEGKYKGCIGSGGNCTYRDGKAVCSCTGNKKLHDTKDICEDCDCGAKESCKFESGIKKCDCVEGFKVKNGACEECNCGSNGICKFEEGVKKCECDTNFSDKDGLCTATCSKDEDCKDREKCVEESGWKSCKCVEGLSGENCDKNDWCVTGKFKNCKGANGTCEYSKDKREVNCNCADGKKLHPKEGRCRETCASNDDCKNGGTCEGNFCTCKLGLIGDKCDIVFDCSSNGKYKGCEESGGNCTFDGNMGACSCPENKKLHDTKNICEVCNCGPKGSCKFENGKEKCDCDSGFGDKDGTCTATCSKDEDCKDREKCVEESGWKSCRCVEGLSGEKCEKNDWCETGKFKNCKGTNGTCEYNKDEREVNCNCADGKKLHPKEGRCRDTCDDNCEHGGTCGEDKFCSCKSGLFGDKCENIFDCTDKGKYRGCKTSGGDCTHDGTNSACTCSDSKIYHLTEHICKKTCTGDENCNGGKCEGSEGKRICNCPAELKGEECEITKKCEEGGTYASCRPSGGECKWDGSKVTCICSGTKKLDKTSTFCREKCSSDQNCTNEAKCDNELCDCKPGTKGDTCSIIIGCEELKCHEKDAECKYDFKQAPNTFCVCKDKNKIFSERRCIEKCNNDCVNGGKCDPQTQLCKCEKGTSGDKCENIEGCDTLKCDAINAKCIFDVVNKKPTCKCADENYYYENNTCKAIWCKERCNNKDNVCEYKDGVGVCKCATEGMYYNFEKEKCEALNKCFNKVCDKEGEVCKNGNCVCGDNYNTVNGTCERKKLCDKDQNMCFSEAQCEETSTFGTVRCFCNDSQFYNHNLKKCEDGSCFLSGKRKDCKENCPTGMERKDDGECKPTEEKYVCGKECGTLGWCYNSSVPVCRCSSKYADLKNGTCVFRKTLCPNQEKDGDDKCKCTGKFKLAKNGITCELKSCSDEDVKNECKKIGAEKCVDGWKDNSGYKCSCPSGYIHNKEKGCIDPCTMDKMINGCSKNGQVCYIGAKQGQGDCRCPPTFTFNTVSKNCEPNGKNTFMIHNLPIVSKKYETAVNNINKVELNIDVRNSMTQTFRNLDFVNVYNVKVKEGVLFCDVWLQFKLDVQDKRFNASLEVQRWKSQTVEVNKKHILPPALFLSEKFKEATEEKLTFCSDSVKQSVCGTGSTCTKDKCDCGEGFREIESTIKIEKETRIVRCEDIDECLEGSHNCSADSSECKNTLGSFFCKCKPGYRKAKGDADQLDMQPCIGLCKENPCNKGTCQLTKENTVDCTCQVGYSGSFCNKKDVNLAKAGKATTVVGAVLGTLLAIVIVLIIFYVIRQKKNSYSEDFTPAPRVDNAEMIERRPMRGVTNRAYQ